MILIVLGQRGTGSRGGSGGDYVVKWPHGSPWSSSDSMGRNLSGYSELGTKKSIIHIKSECRRLCVYRIAGKLMSLSLGYVQLTSHQ